MNKTRCVVVIGLTALLLAGIVYLNMLTGSVSLSAREIMAILTGDVSDEMSRNIILAIRLPRILAAVILGGALALSGYLLQTFFGNPIVGPFVLGISAGAKLTVALTLIVFVSHGVQMGAMSLVAAAFVGAMISMGLVLIFSLRVRSMGILVVCGIMISYICSAITDLTVTFAADSDIVNLHNWSLGSFSGMSLDDVYVMAVLTLICVVATCFLAKPIGVYRLGEAYAKSVGVNILFLRVLLILISGMLAACVTAFAGPISFVGIAVPHLVKNMTKTTAPVVMIPGCFLMGSLVTLFADGIARSIFAPTEVSISSVTAVLLVPVVIAVMLGRRREGNA